MQCNALPLTVAGAAALQSLLAVFVENLPLALVGQHLVRLGDLFELLLGAGRLVLVRMVAQRQFAVRLLDLLLGGRLGQAERAIVVFAHVVAVAVVVVSPADYYEINYKIEKHAY